MAAVKLISPASDNARRWFTGNRFDRIQRQSIVLVFAILRVSSMTSFILIKFLPQVIRYTVDHLNTIPVRRSINVLLRDLSRFTPHHLGFRLR